MTAVVVFGPQACGKTRNKHAIARHFGCRSIVDNWDEIRDHLIDGALHLTNLPPSEDVRKFATVIAFEDIPISKLGEPPVEAVDHPAHYGGAQDPYEAIKVIEAWALGFNLGNTVKYIARAERKGASLQDLEKARWYLDREISNRKASEHG